MEVGEEVLSLEMKQARGFKLVLFIHAERISKDYISVVYRFYALMNKSYQITPPKLPALSSVYINNPSNTSFLEGETRPFVSFSEAWKRVWVDAPENVTHEFYSIQLPKIGTRVLGIIISSANYTSKDSFKANLTYWQEISQPIHIQIDYLSPTYTDLGNQTWIEKHTIMIQNNSNDTIHIPAFEFDRFNYASVNRNSTKAFQNGSLTYSELVWPYRLALYTYIYPGHSMNLTITFLTYNLS